jgi:hypothetical protein
LRIMVKFRFPVEAGNPAMRSGKVGKVMEQIMTDLKPEAAYFYPDAGQRGGHFVFNMTDSLQVAQTAERFFFGLNATIEMIPVMSAEDLQKGLAGVDDIVRAYG